MDIEEKALLLAAGELEPGEKSVEEKLHNGPEPNQAVKKELLHFMDVLQKTTNWSLKISSR